MFENLKKRLQLKKKRGLEYKGPKKISLKRETEIFEMIDKILDSTESYKFDAMYLRENSGIRNGTLIKNDKYKKVLEDELCKLVEENPELKYCVFNESVIKDCKYFLGHHALACAFDKLALQIAQDDYALKMTDNHLGYAMPHYAVYRGRDDVIFEMLKIANIHEVVNKNGNNIGRYIALESNSVKCYLEALKNDKLRTTVFNNGETMGLICAQRREKDFNIASIFTFLAYPDQREAVDHKGENMLIKMAKAGNEELGNLFKHPEVITADMVNIVDASGKTFAMLADEINIKNNGKKGYVPIVIPDEIRKLEEESMRQSIVDYFEK